jgi:hypothetical protein
LVQAAKAARAVVLAQQGSELVGELLPVPQRVLLSPGQDGDRAAEVGVVGQGPVGVHVGAENVRQDQGVAGVGLLARHAVPIAVAGGRHRVDREHLALSSPQDRDQQASGGLDRDRDRILLRVSVLGKQIQQDLVPGRVVGDVPLGQQLAGVVDQGDVVGPFRPVDSAVDQDSPPRSSAFALVTSACGPRAT